MAMIKKQDSPAWDLYWNSARSGDSEGLREALRLGADPDWTSPNKDGTGLHVAVSQGHLECVEILAPISDCRVAAGVRAMTPLALAAAYGRDDCVRELLPRSNPGDRNSYGATAFMLAVEEGQLGAARLLFPSANLSHRNGLRQSALMLAAGEAVPGAVELILSKSKESSEEALDVAMMRDHGDRVGEAKQCAMLILEKMGSADWVLDIAKEAEAKARAAERHEMASFAAAWILSKEERLAMAQAMPEQGSAGSSSGRSKRGRL